MCNNSALADLWIKSVFFWIDLFQDQKYLLPLVIYAFIIHSQLANKTSGTWARKFVAS